ncbi:MAG: DNA gyrase inhibitor YacG [Alphaproteobacteria bacterium]|nr:DNA gyrase inhibitor YacG [Alphaproteobacteria bacterium]MBV9373085.1 DNA gyrase inhibitor YacG [Alphaproteobacteria bacterium]MBV9902885.1 DNA gyrase inhibitor YacG [Alphaproteobacteria bacterium]
MSTRASPDHRGKGCPLCGAPASGRHGPFCGQGCRDRDLLNWLGEGYRAAGPPVADIPESGLDSEA